MIIHHLGFVSPSNELDWRNCHLQYTLPAVSVNASLHNLNPFPLNSLSVVRHSACVLAVFLLLSGSLVKALRWCASWTTHSLNPNHDPLYLCTISLILFHSFFSPSLLLWFSLAGIFSWFFSDTCLGRFYFYLFLFFFAFRVIWQVSHPFNSRGITLDINNLIIFFLLVVFFTWCSLASFVQCW